MRKRILDPLFIICMVAMLGVSCSNDATAPDDSGSPKPQVGTAVIEPDGGDVSARTDNGVVVKLNFPAGAVRVPTSVTVRPLAPQPNRWMTVALEPAGLVFYAPFAIDVFVPEAIGMTDARIVLGDATDPIVLPTDPDVTLRKLSSELTFFGFTADSTMSVPGSPPAAMATAGGGNNLSAGPVDCTQLIAGAKAAFDQMVANNDFEDAVRAALYIASLLRENSCADSAVWLDTARQVGCDGLANAIAEAQSTPTSDFGDFYSQVDEVINWGSMASELDASCAAIQDIPGVIESEANDFIAFFQPHLDALDASSYFDFLNLKGEAGLVFQLATQAAYLGSFDAEDLIIEKAFVPVVDKMRATAYALCKSDGFHLPVSRMTSTGFFSARDMVNTTPPRPGVIHPAPSQYVPNFEDADIFEDLHLCATGVDLETKVASGGQLATGHMEGTSPGVNTTNVSINAPTRGKLVVSGRIAPFECFNNIDGDDEVIFSLNNTDILTLRRPLGNNYLDTPAEFDLLAAAQASGFDPAEGISTDFAIRRVRSNCDERLWGPSEYEMLTATLNWVNPTLQTEVTMADTMQARSSEEVSVRVKVIDQLGQAGFFDAIDVVLNVSGGAAELTSGQTDAQGYFRTSVTPDNPTQASSGRTAAAGMTVTAVATSFEGVSAQGGHTATVLPCDAVDARFRDGGTGNNTKTLEWGHLEASGTAGAGEYSYAATEWIDDYAIYPNDVSLNGQNGFVYVKVHYVFKSTGYSDSRPAARVVIGPRNGYSSPYFWENNYNTPGGTTETVKEGDWEIPLSCTFGRSSAPMDVNCDAFARGTDSNVSVSCELRWLGITKVTKGDGTPIGGYRICSGSGTDWRNPQ